MATKAELCAGPWIGKRVRLECGQRYGTIVGAKAGPMMLDAQNVMRATKRYRIKPDSYGKEFWTQPVVSADTKEPPNA